MSVLCNVSTSSLLPVTPHGIRGTQLNKTILFKESGLSGGLSKKAASHRIQASKLAAEVKIPKVEPKLEPPSFGFTKNAETWNSRACMIGLIGTFIVELVMNKGILEIIGVDVGKGLDLPL